MLGMRLIKGFALLAGCGVLGVAVLLGLLWRERRTPITLPAPTGSFAVGRATDYWVDDAHSDALAPVPGTRRELAVWIWYPAAAGRSAAAMADYLPAPWRTALDRGGSALFRLLTRDLSLVHGHSARNPDVSPQRRSYPVVIMRGGATANVTNYSTLAEDLASHGYVVVGFDAPFRTFVVVLPDGRVITRQPRNNPELYSGQELLRVGNKLLAAWTADVAFVLDRLQRLNESDPSGRFTGRLDLARVGVFGHSLGGATAAQFCRQDARCKAGIDIDGAPLGDVVQAGLRQPFMFLLSEHGDFSSGPEVRRIQADVQSIYERLPADRRLRVAIRGANHFAFSDDGALLKSHLVLGALRALGVLGIDGRRQLAVTAYCVHSFFDAYLQGTGAARPAITSPLYPEIQVLD
jgi:predicted dienelactone hydrolase